MNIRWFACREQALLPDTKSLHKIRQFIGEIGEAGSGNPDLFTVVPYSQGCSSGLANAFRRCTDPPAPAGRYDIRK